MYALKKYLVGIVFLASSVLLSLDNNSYLYVDFDESMKTHEYQTLLQKEHTNLLLQFFKRLYSWCNVRNVTKTDVRIPKIIHQIWLGSSFPEKYKRYQETWLQFHPDWEFKLWTESDIDSFDWENRDLFDEAHNYGEKSDIWRYEILEHYGGLYIDVDFECLKSLEILHYYYDFYIGIQPLDTNMLQLGIGIIGSKAHHPLLQYAIAELQRSHQEKQIIAKTGPVFFTRTLVNFVNRLSTRDGILPASYFYPCGYEQKGGDCEWLKPESFAVHHWAGSWLSREAFVKK